MCVSHVKRMAIMKGNIRNHWSEKNNNFEGDTVGVDP
jgi:hypothetical protein